MAYLSISKLNQYIKSNLESDDKLKGIQVIGEISNLKIHHSGHWYLTLKDEKSRINAVMFSTYAKKVKITISDGMKVILTGDIGVYEYGGTYQLYIHSIDPVGLGNLYLEFEELKKKLNQAGLFSADHKISIPKYPNRIAVISAPQGAAIQDVFTTLKRRWPIAVVDLIPTLVQGKDAASDIVKSLKKADGGDYEVIILARGGGSLEDLWPFNEEIVAKQIYETKTPVISAVGHETDYTISDYVADLRAPTPTAAAELAAPNLKNVIADLKIVQSRMKNAVESLLNNRKQMWLIRQRATVFAKPELIYATKLLSVDNSRNKLIFVKEKYINTLEKKFTDYEHRINSSIRLLFENRVSRFSNIVSKIDALSPLKVLNRGYAIVSKGNIIKTINDTMVGDNIKIRLSDGILGALITEKEKEYGKKD